jgi:hypothetical protein
MSTEERVLFQGLEGRYKALKNTHPVNQETITSIEALKKDVLTASRSYPGTKTGQLSVDTCNLLLDAQRLLAGRKTMPEVFTNAGFNPPS